VIVAALYVARGGRYWDVSGVDPWDEARDARGYSGPYPVVAHPPCERWGRYWNGGPSAKVRRVKGDDGGCFAAALASVRAWGGVLEHPEASSAWPAFGLDAPPRGGGWVAAGDFAGWTCCVEQGHYGHRARKATWLYAVGCELPALQWGAAQGLCARMEAGVHRAAERARARGASPTRAGAVAFLPRRERAATPLPFRDLLLGMARTASGRVHL